MAGDGGLKIVGKEKRIVSSLTLVRAKCLEMIYRLRLRDWGEGHGSDKNRGDNPRGFVHSYSPPGNSTVDDKLTDVTGTSVFGFPNWPVYTARRPADRQTNPYGQRIKQHENSIEADRQGAPGSGPFRENSLAPRAREETIVDCP